MDVAWQLRSDLSTDMVRKVEDMHATRKKSCRCFWWWRIRGESKEWRGWKFVIDEKVGGSRGVDLSGYHDREGHR